MNNLLGSFIDNLMIESPSTAILLTLTIVVAIGFFMTRITRLLHLPDATGYIIAGILIGPSVLNLIPTGIAENLDFISDIALGFIAFGVGKYVIFEKDSKDRTRILVITLCETIITLFAVVFVMKVIFGFDLAFSFLLGSIACATAPASTIMTINQYKAKGPFISSLIKIIAIDDCIAILLFHIILFVTANPAGTITTLGVLLPLFYNLGVIGVGILFGLFLSAIGGKFKSKSQKLLTGLLLMLILVTGCSFLELSPLLACMAFGISYSNATGDKEIFEIFHKFSPPIILLFFINSGLKLNLSMLASLGIIGIAYFAVRILSKVGGAYVGGQITYSSPRIKKYVGLALIPQASISIGLATLASRVLPVELSETLSVIVISSAVLYELIGPILSKYAIFKSNSVSKRNMRLYDGIGIHKKEENVEISSPEKTNNLTQTKELKDNNIHNSNVNEKTDINIQTSNIGETNKSTIQKTRQRKMNQNSNKSVETPQLNSSSSNIPQVLPPIKRPYKKRGEGSITKGEKWEI